MNELKAIDCSTFHAKFAVIEAAVIINDESSDFFADTDQSFLRSLGKHYGIYSCDGKEMLPLEFSDFSNVYLRRLFGIL